MVDKFLMQLEAQLHEKKVERPLQRRSCGLAGEKGFDPMMGAPDGAADPGHIRSALADELPVRAAGQRRQQTIDLDDDDKVT